MRFLPTTVELNTRNQQLSSKKHGDHTLGILNTKKKSLPLVYLCNSVNALKKYYFNSSSAAVLLDDDDDPDHELVFVHVGGRACFFWKESSSLN